MGLRSGIVLGSLFVLVGLGGALSGSEGGDRLSAPSPAVAECSVDLEKGYYPPHDLPSGASTNELACFAWREFIALNWPAVQQTFQPNTRGVPDATATFASSGARDFYDKGGRLVWETYKHKVEMFPGGGKSPSASYDTKPVYSYDVQVSIGKNSQGGKADVNLFNNVDEATEITQNHLFFPATPPNPGKSDGETAVDKDIQVLFEVKLNRREYDYIYKNSFYQASPAFNAATNTKNYLMGMARRSR